MPAATVPVSKPAAPKKPAGVSKPAGFSKPAVDEDDEEEEQPKDNKVILGIAAFSVILMLIFAYLQYGVDQTYGRHSDGERLFGSPSSAAASSEDAGSSEEAPAEESSEEEEAPAEEAAAEEESGDEDDYSDIEE